MVVSGRVHVAIHVGGGRGTPGGEAIEVRGSADAGGMYC